MKSTQEVKDVSKIFGIDEFTPIKLDVDILSYNKANQEAEALLNNFNNALSWVYDNHVQEADISIKAFNDDMVMEFQKAFMKRNAKVIKLDVSFEKLLNLLDVNLDALKEFQYTHHDNPQVAKVIQPDDKLKVKIDMEDFTTYTKNQYENDMLEAAGDLMLALDKVNHFSKVYPLTITQGISNFLLFDMKQNKYRINRSLFPKHI
tara:strand:- start:805 stop:1419 length:615 start_codon:yes stop_codon:yes gene_type:complete